MSDYSKFIVAVMIGAPLICAPIFAGWAAGTPEETGQVAVVAGVLILLELVFLMFGIAVSRDRHSRDRG